MTQFAQMLSHRVDTKEITSTWLQMCMVHDERTWDGLYERGPSSLFECTCPVVSEPRYIIADLVNEVERLRWKRKHPNIQVHALLSDRYGWLWTWDCPDCGRCGVNEFTQRVALASALEHRAVCKGRS